MAAGVNGGGPFVKLNLEPITSRQNPLIVETMKLSQRKYRDRTGTFRFDGVKLTGEALKNALDIRVMFFRQGDAETVAGRVLSLTGMEALPPCRCVVLPDELFLRMSEEAAPEGVMTVAAYQTKLHVRHTEPVREDAACPLASAERGLLLEAIRDPSNLGAIIRSAAAFGMDRLILSENCADIYSAKTVRASMGTLFSQPISVVSDFPQTIRCLRRSGRRVYAAALREESLVLGRFETNPKDCVVIGNEGHGLQQETIAACDASVFIPMTERAESLNAAVAASVLMWAFSREEADEEAKT